jgi:hypothetical protein
MDLLSASDARHQVCVETLKMIESPMLTTWLVLTEAQYLLRRDQYEDINPQIADASLMYLAAQKNIDTIFTLDRRDFSIYRFSNKKVPKILPSLYS